MHTETSMPQGNDCLRLAVCPLSPGAHNNN